MEPRAKESSKTDVGTPKQHSHPASIQLMIPSIHRSSICVLIFLFIEFPLHMRVCDTVWANLSGSPQSQLFFPYMIWEYMYGNVWHKRCFFIFFSRSSYSLQNGSTKVYAADTTDLCRQALGRCQNCQNVSPEKNLAIGADTFSYFLPWKNLKIQISRYIKIPKVFGALELTGLL